MRYAELDRLRTDLLALSQREPRSDRDLLKAANLGVRSFRDPMVAQLIAKIASRLHHPPPDRVVRDLCRGALVSALRLDGTAREQLPFALRLIERASATQSLPLASPLSDPIKDRAASYFARYSEAPARVEKLAHAARAFATQNASIAGGVLFARLLADLEFLNEILESATSSDDERRTAAGALTYFVETNDAIEDELGIIGILDDAYILQLAAERIAPIRRVKTALVDGLLGQWPFLAALRLEVDGQDWAPSEFVLVNLAVAFGPERAAKNVIVLPSADEMPLLLGLLASLGSLCEAVERGGEPFRPNVGDQICLGGDDAALYEVVAYLAGPAANQLTDAREARFVSLKYLPRSRRAAAPPVKHTNRVEILDGCRPAPGERPRRRTSLPPSASDAAIGPIEQLFSLDRPARFSRNVREIVVVTPLVHARAFLGSTKLLGQSLRELIPCGAASPEDDFRIDWWSSSRGFVAPVLTIARDLTEAAAVLSRRTDGTSEIITTIDKDEWESAALRQSAATDMVAFVPQHRREVQAALRADGFKFLDWTDELEGTLSRRPLARKPTAIDAYETRVRRELRADVRVHDVHLDSVETSFDALRALSKAVREEFGDDVPESLAIWAARASSVSFDLAAEAVVVRDSRAAALQERLRVLRDGLGPAAALWSDRCRAGARKQLEELARAAEELQRGNPKAEALGELIRTGKVAVRCGTRSWDALHGEFPRAVRWSRAPNIYGPVAVFEWRGAEKMARLLLPPVGDPTHVVFYRWEQARLAVVQRQRATELAAHWRGDVRHAGWHLDDIPTRTDTHAGSVSADSGPPIALEEWAASLQRQRVLANVARGPSGDQIVDAITVVFGSSRYALYEPYTEIHVATHLVGLARAERASLREKEARHLRPGDVVVIVQGSSKDAIRELADRVLPAGARDLARAWHMPLRELRERLGSDRAVCERLRGAGCGKLEATIQAWLRSTTQIGPHDEQDLDSIAHATGDTAFIARLPSCKDAIRKVRGEHIRASHELATRAIEALAKQLESGEEIESGVALGDRVELLTVESVDSTLLQVAASLTGVVEALA